MKQKPVKPEFIHKSFVLLLLKVDKTPAILIFRSQNYQQEKSEHRQTSTEHSANYRRFKD